MGGWPGGWVVGKLESNAKLNSKLRLKLKLELSLAKSKRLNSVMITFMNLGNLQLSRTKCNNIHIGKGNEICHTLKVHGTKMKSSNQELYLGDVIDKSGKAKPNIEKRKLKGYGIIANILAIINELPLAHWKQWLVLD